MKPITMNFYTVLFFVVISDNSCSASFCKSSKKLWSCTNGTATFNEDIFEKVRYVLTCRYLSRFYNFLVHPNLSATLDTDQKWPLGCCRISYQSLAECHLPDSLISTVVNGSLLNFGKRYKDDLRVIFDQWPKLHFGLDALNNQK